MEGRLKVWRTARICAIWALLKCGVPRDVVRFNIVWRLNWRYYYCWGCLHRRHVHMNQDVLCFYYDGNDKLPVCSMTCMSTKDIPNDRDLLLAYEWLVMLAGRRDGRPAGCGYISCDNKPWQALYSIQCFLEYRARGNRQLARSMKARGERERWLRQKRRVQRADWKDV